MHLFYVIYSISTQRCVFSSSAHLPCFSDIWHLAQVPYLIPLEAVRLPIPLRRRHEKMYQVRVFTCACNIIKTL